MIELRDIYKTYGHELVLENISITLPETGMIGLLGKSGSGKSTLLYILAGLDLKHGGKIFVDGELSLIKDKKRIAIMLQKHELVSWLSVHHNIRLYDDFHSSLFPSLSLFHISSYMHSAIPLLSLGQRQRIALNRSFYYQPDIILCDEPTASLDHQCAQEVMCTLKEYAKEHLVLVASHDEELIHEYCTDVLILEDGHLEGHIKKRNKGKSTAFHHDYKRFFVLFLSLVKGHLSSYVRLSFVFFVTMCMLMACVNMTCSFRKEVQSYLHELLPRDALSFRCTSCPLSLDKEKYVSQVFLYPEDYELLGISLNPQRFNQRECIEVMDESQGVKRVALGRYARNDNEIIVSRTLFNRLGRQLNRSYYLYYHHGRKAKGVKVKVVGVSYENKKIEIYYRRRGNLTLIEQCFHHKVNYRYGILYYTRGLSLSYLIRKYPELHFKKVGKKSEDQVSQFFNKIEAVLFLFASLAIVSTIFFMCANIDELIYKMRKDIALFYCLYAKKGQLFVLYYMFVLSCFLFSSLLSFLCINYLMIFINKEVIPTFINARFLLRWPYLSIIKMMISSLLVVIFITGYTLRKQLNIDIVNVLKEN